MTRQELVDRYFLARILWWRNDIETLDAATVAQLRTILESVKREILATFDAQAQALTSVTEWREDRLRQVDAWIDELLSPVNAGMTATISTAAVAATTASLATYNATLAFDGKALAVKTVGLTAEQLEAFFVNDPLSNRVLGEWVSQSFDDGVKASIRSALQSSVVMGEGSEKAVRRLLQQAILDGFALTERQADTLARTYIQSGDAAAQEAVYKNNAHIVKGVVWSTAHDNHVCPLCAPLDGMRWKNGEEHPPFKRHPNCRCTLLPIVYAKDLDIAPDALRDVATPWVLRDPGTLGKRNAAKIYDAGTTRENFPGWWATLPYAEQTKSIGAIRTRLIRAGDLRWSDLVNKHTGAYRTLHELGYTLRGQRVE